ncbi:Crp/Fnr family transcriptional regulator [Paenibacillus psychroresistens]|uniref:Crp/Fnr family transcriptional regulator n=1 Tax=Paenibacillus psychroresistens TaxID=1778678 RepID=A0A6B8RF04_9BACL|nr:Crp/Fnr family transcriptional regulator [Paenibacillus psychroresistens]QGQ94760.1 Crp/Fnr family transcriptional regulator [Paenibacillus psychroresistens]
MIEYLRMTSLFADLTSVHLERIAEECTMSTYPAGKILFHENDTGTVFYVVVFGAIKIYTSNINGEDKILSILTRNDSFGEISLLDGKPRSATAQTIEETRLIALTGKNFNNLLRTNFEITLNIIKQLSTRLRETNRQVHDLTYLDAKQRILKNLVTLAKTHGRRNKDTFTIKVNLDYDEMAQFAGVTKTLLFEVFSELQSKDILKVLNNQYVLDLTKLK